ncbi:DgyrCDS9632 [Dimorphilus gyrociliatus]|uniref:Dynein regulatory complex protein 10 n=1 Tax=Dimorphilus gyrociliatus TaxID=2664684 RepID=A0A7I8VYY6_9ANNE|nr:DgyrCDS9632 [Dimorphilus gyrociliatus]
MTTVSEPSIAGEKMSKLMSQPQNITQYEPKRSKVPKVDPIRTLEPARKKVSTVEAQRVLHTLLDSIKKLEIAVNIEYIIDNMERFNVAFGQTLVKKFLNHQQLLEKFDTQVFEMEKLFIEQRQKRIRELKRRVRRGSDISGEEDAYLLEQNFDEEEEDHEEQEDEREYDDEGEREEPEQSQQEEAADPSLEKDPETKSAKATDDGQSEQVLTPRPPSTSRPSSTKSSVRRGTTPTSQKSVSSTDSRIVQNINELQQNLIRINSLISDSTRNIQRCFAVDPGAYDAFHKDIDNDEIDYDAEVKQFLEFVYELRNIITRKLLTSPVEELENNKCLKEIEARARNHMDTIAKLEGVLKELEEEKNNEIKDKNNIIRNLQNQLHTIERVSEESIKQVKSDADKQELADKKNSEGRQGKLAQEVAALKQQYQNELQEHRSIEADLRNKKYKNETEVENWINRYDENMGSRQEKYEEIDEQYTKEKKQLNELEERFKTLEEEYKAIMAEREAERERREKEARELQLCMQAATTIQAFWRSFKVRKAIRTKKKGKRGKNLSNYGHEIGVSIAERYKDLDKEKQRNSFLNGTVKDFETKIQQAVNYLTNSTKIQRENIKGSFGFDWPQSIDIPLTYLQAIYNELGDNSYDTTFKDKDSQNGLAKWPSFNNLLNLTEIYTPSYASKKKGTKQYVPCFELGASHCHPVETADEIRNILWKDFVARDKEFSNRAPFILNVPLYSIVDYSHAMIAIDQFLDLTLNLGDDVWVVTASQMIDWIKSNETVLNNLREFEGFGCKDFGKFNKLNCSAVADRCSDFTGLLKCKDKNDTSEIEYPNPDFAKIDGNILLLVQTIVLILAFAIFVMREKVS